MEIDHHGIAYLAGADAKGPVLCGIRVHADLTREVQADVQKLVGVGEHSGQRRSQFEVGFDGMLFELWSDETHGGLQD
jgi:hypothetical protein